MLFALICNDKPGHLQVRIDTRPEHVAHLKSLNETGVLKLAGPFIDGDGKPNGSLMVVEASDAAAAKAIADADPFTKAGLFASVEVRQWNWTLNNPGAV